MRTKTRKCGIWVLAALTIGSPMLEASSATATDASTIQSIVERISVEASNLSKAAHAADPSLEVVTNKAINLSATMGRLAAAIYREPDEASSHADALKQLGRDEVNLGLAMIGLSNSDTGTEKDSIADIAAIADDIQDDALAY